MCACNKTLDRMKPFGWVVIHADDECLLAPEDTMKPVLRTPKRIDRPMQMCLRSPKCKDFKPC